MNKQFVAAALAVLMSSAVVAPAFAQQGYPALGAKAAEQATPKAGTKVQHGSDKAKADVSKKADKTKAEKANKPKAQKTDKKG